MARPLLQDTLNQRGAEGWELVSVITGVTLYGAADRMQLYFKQAR